MPSESRIRGRINSIIKGKIRSPLKPAHSENVNHCAFHGPYPYTIPFYGPFHGVSREPSNKSHSFYQNRWYAPLCSPSRVAQTSYRLPFVLRLPASMSHRHKKECLNPLVHRNENSALCTGNIKFPLHSIISYKIMNSESEKSHYLLDKYNY